MAAAASTIETTLESTLGSTLGSTLESEAVAALPSLLSRSWSSTTCLLACAVAVGVAGGLGVLYSQGDVQLRVRIDVRPATPLVSADDMLLQNCSSFPAGMNMTTWDSAKRSAYWLTQPPYQHATSLIGKGIRLPLVAARDPYAMAVWLSLTTPKLGGVTSWWNTSTSSAQLMCTNSHFQNYFASLQTISDAMASYGYDPLALQNNTSGSTTARVASEYTSLDIDNMQLGSCPNPDGGSGRIPCNCGSYDGYETPPNLRCANPNALCCGSASQWPTTANANYSTQPELSTDELLELTKELWLSAKGMVLDAHMSATQASTLMTQTCVISWRAARQLTFLSNRKHEYRTYMGYGSMAIPTEVYANVASDGTFPVKTILDNYGSDSIYGVSIYGNLTAAERASVAQANANDDTWLHPMSYEDMALPSHYGNNLGYNVRASITTNLHNWCMSKNPNRITPPSPPPPLSETPACATTTCSPPPSPPPPPSSWGGGAGWSFSMQNATCSANGVYRGINGCWWPFDDDAQLPQSAAAPIYSTHVPLRCFSSGGGDGSTGSDCVFPYYWDGNGKIVPDDWRSIPFVPFTAR